MYPTVYRVRSIDIVVVISHDDFPVTRRAAGFYVALQLLRLHICMLVPTRALW